MVCVACFGFMSHDGHAGRKTKKKRKVDPWDDISDDDGGEEGSDKDDWVMHQPTLASLKKQQGSQKTDAAVAAKQKKREAKPKRLPTVGMDAFASADDYMQDIETDLAAVGADVALTEAADEKKINRPHKKKQKQMQRGRNQS